LFDNVVGPSGPFLLCVHEVIFMTFSVSNTSIKKSNVQCERLMGISFLIFQAILSPLWWFIRTEEGDSLEQRKGEGVFGMKNVS
jgi:hypothetical protein